MKENRYYVYLHKIASTGEVFYVGKGCGYRLRSQQRRNAVWKKITEDNEWVAEKYEDNLSETEAYAVEVDLISKLNPIANLQKKSTAVKPIKRIDVERLFYYCESSKSGLRFRTVNSNRFKVGDEAGTKGPSGYYRVKIQGVNYLAHRIVWVLFNTDLHCGIIDHKDKNRSNNKISNLRVVTPPINNKNSSLRKSNNTGFIGVSFVERSNSYVVKYSTDESRQERKYFSVLKYGKDLALALAIEYRHQRIMQIDSYLPQAEYKRHPALLEFSEEDISTMLNCDLSASNTSGISGISFSSVGQGFWCYRKVGANVARFSCKKYGNEFARQLAIEYKQFVEGGSSSESLSYALRKELDKISTRANAPSIRGIYFTGLNKDIITAQKMLHGKRVAKSFSTIEYGLLPATYMALRWREEDIKKE